MAAIGLAPGVFDDFDRIFDHIARFDVGSAPARIEEIIRAIDILTTSPWIGRPTGRDERSELVIGRAPRGYVALYRFVPEIDTVFVLAIRSQREAGFRPA